MTAAQGGRGDERWHGACGEAVPRHRTVPMLNAYAPHLDSAASRMLGDALMLTADHPVAMASLLAGLAGMSAAMLLAVVRHP